MLRVRSLVFVWPVLAILAGSSCQRVPLLAPSGSTITLTTSATVLPVNGSTNLIAQVIEPAGTPPHQGTHVSFLTTLGTVSPSEAETDINGQAVVKFLAGTASGVANITASSGGSSTGSSGTLKISVGAAAVGRVTVSASPASVPSLGGTSTITANVFDINGNALGSTPVSFTTTAGTLSANLVTTNSGGIATAELSTSQQATVTATVGAQGSTDGGTGGGTTTPTPSGQASGSVVVTVTTGPTLVITPPTTPPSAGLPAIFTFSVTLAQNGAAVRNVSVDWGDGSRQSLGAVTGNAVVSHVYDDAGTFVVSGTVTDAAGNTSSVSTSVTVIPVPRPTIIITSSPVPAKANTLTTITIQVTVPSGVGVVDTLIDFGDGTKADLGGATSAAQPHVYTTTGTFTVTVTVTDTTGQTTIGTTVISVGL